jgi:hypothetical protein
MFKNVSYHNMIMAQTKRLGKQRIRNSAASKKPNITQEIRKGKNTIEAGEAPAAAKRPTVSCQTAYFPLRRIKKGPYTARRSITPGKTGNGASSSLRKKRALCSSP